MNPAGRVRCDMRAKYRQVHSGRSIFQFARLLRSRPSGVRGPVLLPP
jgi:hypothetical protein